MPTPKRFVVILIVASLAGIVLYEAFVIRWQRDELTQREGSIVALRAARSRTHAAPTPPAPSQPLDAALPRDPDPSGTTPSPDERIALLKQLLDELPAQRLPELRLLTPFDWIEIARAHELDTAADIRVALADLRAIARKKFATQLQEALRKFTVASGGQLPTDVNQLASHLTDPADAEMLARYDLLRSGRLGDPAEGLLREKPASDMILSVSLDGWNLSNNSELPAAFGETETDALERAWRALGTALGDEAKEKMATMASPRAMSELMQGAVQALEPIYGSSEAVGEAMKAAVRTFLTAHPGEAVTDVAQILPFLKDSDKFVVALRPAFAQLEYTREHSGQRPADPSLLRPYLVRPFDLETLRELKLKWDGEHLSMTYSWTK